MPCATRLYCDITHPFDLYHARLPCVTPLLAIALFNAHVCRPGSPPTPHPPPPPPLLLACVTPHCPGSHPHCPGSHPIVLGHTPIALGHTPFALGHTPVALGHTPVALGHIPVALGHLPVALDHTPGVALFQTVAARSARPKPLSPRSNRSTRCLMWSVNNNRRRHKSSTYSRMDRHQHRRRRKGEPRPCHPFNYTAFTDHSSHLSPA